jgi:hypothetical protein
MTKAYRVRTASRERAAELLRSGRFSQYASGGRLYLLPLDFERRTAYAVEEA